MPTVTTTVDGNEAAARIAHLLSEVIAIYPITPASPMGELADAWSHQGRPNLWGVTPDIVEMQSEAGAAGNAAWISDRGRIGHHVHRIARPPPDDPEHVQDRGRADSDCDSRGRPVGCHPCVVDFRGPLRCDGCSSDGIRDAVLVLGSRSTRPGARGTPGHARDQRSPFLHFFDGFRTSHEVAKIELIEENVIRGLVDEDHIARHRLAALDPARPTLKGTAQNPDVFFQAREASNRFYLDTPAAVEKWIDAVATVTGREHRLFEYYGAPEATNVMVIMGSGAGAAKEAVRKMNDQGDKVGVLVVKLYRPFSLSHFEAALPPSTERLVVMDRTKEPGAIGEPLYLDVVSAVSELGRNAKVIGGRYGLSSKEFTPAMVKASLDEARNDQPKNHFTVGITDDVTRTSIDTDGDWWSEPDHVRRAVFYGLGSDGTVGANKSSVKIIGDNTDFDAQGYFVYDSKKSGSRTVSHLRISPEPIESTYLISQADFVAVHQFDFLERSNVLDVAAPGATVLINTPYGDRTWSRLPVEAQQQVLDKELELWGIDAASIAREAGLGSRVNTVLQTCFFHLTDLLPTDDAIAHIKEQIAKMYGKRGMAVIERNNRAVDNAVAGLARVSIGSEMSHRRIPATVPEDAPEFVQRVTSMIMEGKGDLLPVSAMPVDGTFPTGTSIWEKRSIAHEIPIWDPSICIDCARCALVCPHAAIRFKAFDPDIEVPDGFLWKESTGADLRGKRIVIQVAPDECTGCAVCVDVCPAKSKDEVKHKAINMEIKDPHLERERANYQFFLEIPELDRTEVNAGSVKGSQLLQPLFESSGACAGCGETPYLKLLTQQLGDRMIIANATGCSSIYGGNLPTTPWSPNGTGQGPAWSNSLFEDNAEFGLGMRLAFEAKRTDALLLVTALAPELGDLAVEILDLVEDPDRSDVDLLVKRQRDLVDQLRSRLAELDGPLPRRLEGVADALVEQSVWIVGGDGWAYDIGFGGLDHVLASGRDINILVLDTEVYSNTGGQASKATPRAAIAKFAAGGKPTGKKDLGQIAMSYGNVYVGQIAMGANPTQTVKTLSEAEAHEGVSLVVAYSPCIAHGIDMSTQMSHQKEATSSGYWPLYRYDPGREAEGLPGLRLDSRKPTIPFKDFASKEARFAMLRRVDPERADELIAGAQRDIDDRWHLYEQMVTIHRTAEYTEVEE